MSNLEADRSRGQTVATVRRAFGAVLLVSAAGLACRTPPPPAFDTPAALIACVQAAISPRGLIQQANSFHVVVDAVPVATNTNGRRSTRDFWLGSTDNFRRTTEVFTPQGDVIVSEIRELMKGNASLRVSDGTRYRSLPLEADGALALRHEYARLLYTFFLRPSALVPFTIQLHASDSAASRTIVATGPDDFNLQLVVDANSCLITEAGFERRSNWGDGAAESSAPIARAGFVRQRYVLADYVDLGGFMMPSTLRLSVNGVPTEIWTITGAQLSEAPK